MPINPEETEEEDEFEESLAQELGEEKAEEIISLRGESINRLKNFLRGFKEIEGVEVESGQASSIASYSPELRQFTENNMGEMAEIVFDEDRCVENGRTEDSRAKFGHTERRLKEYAISAMGKGSGALKEIKRDMATAEEVSDWNEDTTQDFTERLQGFFVGALHTDRPGPAIQALEEIAKLNKEEPAGVIEKYKSLIDRVGRRAHEGDKESINSPEITSRFLDSNMKRFGYSYDSQEGTYKKEEE